MTSHKERVERLTILSKRKRELLDDGNSEVLTRHILDDYMVNIWFLGHQTRADYQDTLWRSQETEQVTKEWKSALD
jgi:hypothetical protein